MTTNAHQEKHQFQAEVKQLLDIVVHSLYSNKEIFLRELISNASDAADKLRFEGLSNSVLYESDPELKVKLIIDQANRTLTISDNGIGMTRDEVIENLGTIAKSGTKAFLSALSASEKADAHLIGQFGVGFYSAFMVADSVMVKTRRAGESADDGVCWESDGSGEYTIETINKPTRGTDITLKIKVDQEEYISDYRLRSIISKYSDHLNLPIQMKKADDDGKPTEEWETINKATALWTVPKSQIKPDQYQAFYKHISHDFENPLSYTHHKVEGTSIDYTTILYIPSQAPFDLFQRDAHHGLKLYVQRVFIMDEVEQFLPNYLRFVKGVLDTSSLPLNISREILQDHPVITKLRSALVKHVLDHLEKLAKDDEPTYVQFWQQFGNVLKEGPAEDFANRDRIAKLLRFASTKSTSANDMTTLADYVARMKPQQTKIYYITADNYNTAKSSPHLEVFDKNGIEVLLLTDRIDEWVVSHLPEFDGKALQSVAKGDLSLDEIKGEDEKQAEEKQQEEKRADFEGLLEKVKAQLQDQIKEVRLTNRLTNSPACLVRDENALGPQMERLLKAAGQPVEESKPIFELNPDHTIVRKLKEVNDDKRFAEWTSILFEQALLAEGSALPDPAAFVQRVNQLWLEMVA